MEATRYAKRIPGILQVHATRGERNSQLRSSHCLLLSHPLLIHQAMFLSQILRRIWRRMMMKTLRKILLIILPTEEMMAMIRMSPSDDDEDDDVDIKGDEEEEEHLAPADSTAVALPAVDHAPFAEETEPFKTDESAATLKYNVMSNSKDSTVTYIVVSSLFGGLSDIGSSGVDGPPVMPEDPYAYVVAAFQAPPSSDYVSGPEYPPSLEFVPELVYPEFMPPEDEVLPAEEQPLPAAASPTTDSPRYVTESDPEEDSKEDDDEDPEEDPADYPGEEHPAPADSTAVALPAVDHAPSAGETEPFETYESAATPPPHLAYRVTARISIRYEPPIPFWSDTEVARLLAIPTPPPSPISPWSSSLPQIPSPPLPPILSPLPVSSSLPVSPPLPLAPPPLLVSPTYPLGYKLLKRLQTQMTEFERQQGPAKGPAQPDAPEEAGSSS
ncbi:hypothetical protein Tco_0966381 [Tanacetum coccineum]